MLFTVLFDMTVHDHHCHCEERSDVAISCIELRCAAVRGDSHGPYGASE